MFLIEKTMESIMVSIGEKSPNLKISKWVQGMDTNLAGGSVQYMRFWLNVPGTQSAGNYINEINFKGLQTGTACNT